MSQSDITLGPDQSNDSIAKTREARCHCGYLVAKLRKDGVELKCRRCKRIIVLPFQASGTDEHILEPCQVP
ncbi:MAG: hypothetical protein O2999_10745 [Nitrospirae bacterium]|nr:hypothetical protein [Nitrospirota bacterium]MDA1304761.1 hypothetical protein [Nitrospirota bacterium]